MNVEKGKKRILGACILFLMVLLTAFTVAVAADGDPDSSYSLIIEKIFADGTPEAAKNLKYTFKIQGRAEKSDGTVTKEFDETVTLPDKDGNWEHIYTADAPITATVTEVTSGIQLEQGGADYNMRNTRCVTEATVTGTQKLQLKNNASITLSKPAKEGDKALTTSWFHIYNEPYPGHHDVIKKVDEVVEIVPGAPTKVFDGLPAGIYIVEELLAKDGYSVLVGPREETIAPGDDGKFYINGNPGRLTVTAGGTKGDGATHYYTITRQKQSDDKENGIEFKDRTNRVNSGEEWVIDDLPKGNYTVTEHTYAGQSGYTLTVPNKSAELASRSGYVTSLSSTTTRKWGTFTARYPDQTAYIHITGFGKLLNESNQALSASDTYATVHYGISTPGGIVRKGGYANSTPFKGNLTYTISNPVDLLLDTNKTFGFSVTEVKSTAAKKLVVSWKEYGYVEPTPSTVNKSFGVSVTKTVDGRGWMLFSKDADDSPGAENLTYHYTITSDDKKSVANCFITDADDNPLNSGMVQKDGYTVELSLKPGESVKLNGLQKGTYSITESVDQDVKDGFSMAVNGCAVNVTQTNTPYRVEVQGPRTLTIGKPGCKDGVDDHGRIYTFQVLDTNGNPVKGMENIKLTAGGTVTTAEKLPKSGTYTVVPTNELEPFQMNYTDSTTVTGLASGKPARITFENVFSVGNGSYRYIHEYYLKHADNTYTYEGSNEVTHVRGLDLEKEKYFQALDLTEDPNFTINGINYTYTHFSEGYGIVNTPSTQNDEEETPVSPISDMSPETLEEPEASTLPDSSSEDGEETVRDMQTELSGEHSEDADDSADNNEDSGDLDDSSDNNRVDEDSGISVHSNEDEADSDDLATDNADGESLDDSSKNNEEVKNPSEEPAVISSGGNEDIADSSGQSLEKNASNVSPSDGTVVYDDIPTHGSGVPGNNGILIEGSGIETSSDSDKGQPLSYKVDPDMDHANVTKNGSNIIILRYFREVPEDKKGTYKVVHEYYYRDDKGDHWEGASAITSSKPVQMGHPYKVDSVERINTFTPKDGRMYTYTYDGRAQYGVVNPDQGVTESGYSGNPAGGYTGVDAAGNGYRYRPDTDKTSVTATEDGSQIIILRYYRDVKGAYNIVHEYYVRKPDTGGSEGEEASGEENTESSSETGVLALNTASDSADTFENTDVSRGTLDSNDGYVYTLEGVRDIDKVRAKLDTTHEGTEEDWRLDYNSRTYQYLNVAYGETKANKKYEAIADKQWATATEDADQLIILRYFRDPDPDEPDTPDPPDSNDPVKPGGNTDGKDSGSKSDAKSGVAPTGDSSHLELWILLAIGSFVSMIQIARSRRQRS